MKNFKEIPQGQIGLIQRTKHGEIVQIALSQEQSDLLQIFLATLSKKSSLVRLPKEYNLTLNQESPDDAICLKKLKKIDKIARSIGAVYCGFGLPLENDKQMEDYSKEVKKMIQVLKK